MGLKPGSVVRAETREMNGGRMSNMRAIRRKPSMVAQTHTAKLLGT